MEIVCEREFFEFMPMLLTQPKKFENWAFACTPCAFASTGSCKARLLEQCWTSSFFRKASSGITGSHRMGDTFSVTRTANYFLRPPFRYHAARIPPLSHFQ